MDSSDVHYLGKEKRHVCLYLDIHVISVLCTQVYCKLVHKDLISHIMDEMVYVTSETYIARYDEYDNMNSLYFVVSRCHGNYVNAAIGTIPILKEAA